MSYIYFDINGRLRETVSTPTRKGSEGVDRLFVYWEGVEDSTKALAPAQCTILYGKGSTTAGPLTATSVADSTIPFDKGRDLKFFRYGESYRFIRFDLPAQVTSLDGYWNATVSIHDLTTKNVVQVLGDIAFEVEKSVIVPSGNLDLSQYNYLLEEVNGFSGRIDNCVPKLEGDGTYKVYMVGPNGENASRLISSGATANAAVLRQANGQVGLPNQDTYLPGTEQAVSRRYVDGKFVQKAGTSSFGADTLFLWKVGDVNAMAIGGSSISLYNIATGDLQTEIKASYVRLSKENVNIYWSDIRNAAEIPLANGDTSELGSGARSQGNTVSLVKAFEGEDITNTAKGLNSMSLGRLNKVEGMGSFAYGNKNTIKGVGCIAFGGGNKAGTTMDWSSTDPDNPSSIYCFTLGENNESTGRGSFAIGTSNRATGQGSIAVGNGNQVDGKNAIALGSDNKATALKNEEMVGGDGAILAGKGLQTPYRTAGDRTANYWDCIVLGRYNDPDTYSIADSADLPYMNNYPAIFTLGAGRATTRQNAIVVFHDSGATTPRNWTYLDTYTIFKKDVEFRGSKVDIKGNLKLTGELGKGELRFGDKIGFYVDEDDESLWLYVGDREYSFRPTGNGGNVAIAQDTLLYRHRIIMSDGTSVTDNQCVYLEYVSKNNLKCSSVEDFRLLIGFDNRIPAEYYKLLGNLTMGDYAPDGSALVNRNGSAVVVKYRKFDSPGQNTLNVTTVIDTVTSA